MPELPEVESTVRSINRLTSGLKIVDVWSNYDSPFHAGKQNIKDVGYFKKFKKLITGRTILNATRRAKNILINLSGGETVLVHMKMTGHFLYGTFKKKPDQSAKNSWLAVAPESLKDPFNRFISLVFSLSNGKQLAFSDLRRFAKVFCLSTATVGTHPDILKLGPEPLDKKFTFEIYKKCLNKKPKGKIKQSLMDQEVISGIGNIYSDEILWEAGIHPESITSKIPDLPLKKSYISMKKILNKSIILGGDSASDFRNIDGTKAGYQKMHKAYRLVGEKCSLKRCLGTIRRLKVGGRSAHFCDKHQHRY